MAILNETEWNDGVGTSDIIASSEHSWKAHQLERSLLEKISSISAVLPSCSSRGPSKHITSTDVLWSLLRNIHRLWVSAIMWWVTLQFHEKGGALCHALPYSSLR